MNHWMNEQNHHVMHTLNATSRYGRLTRQEINSLLLLFFEKETNGNYRNDWMGKGVCSTRAAISGQGACPIAFLIKNYMEIVLWFSMPLWLICVIGASFCNFIFCWAVGYCSRAQYFGKKEKWTMFIQYLEDFLPKFVSNRFWSIVFTPPGFETPWFPPKCL